MPAIEEKYQHIRHQMVRNFIVWAIFMGLIVLLLLPAFWQNNSWPPSDFSRFPHLIVIAIAILVSYYIPLLFIEKAPFNYHNDSGRMFAYRIKLGLTMLILLFIHVIICYYMLIFGIDKFIGLLLFIALFRSYKLRPSANVWVDFRMRYRAGRTMPVRVR